MNTTSIRRLRTNAVLAFKASIDVVFQPLRMLQAVGMFTALIIILQWLFQPQAFWAIVSSSALTVAEKADVIVGAFFSVFQLIDDLTPVSFIVIALFQSIALVMWLELRGIAQGRARQSIAPLGMGLIGSGCVACSGSIFSPFLAAVASGFSVSVAELLGDGVLIIAVALSVRAWHKIALQYWYLTSRERP